MTSSTDNRLDNNSEKLAGEAVKLLLEKLGQDVKLYDVRNTDAITDFYVVATGKSLSHVSSLADDLCEKTALIGRHAFSVEGERGNSWILVDYLDVIVHIFDKQSRDFYNFDRLMPSESLVDIEEYAKEVDKKFEH